MIPITHCANQKIAVFGLGGSGVATANALLAGGADVLGFDDTPDSVDMARAAGIPVGDFRDVDFTRFDALVLAPGVPLTHPVPHWSVELARDAGLEIIGDVELFARERRVVAPDIPFVAITGTNGKSTTTVLIAHLLNQAGYDVQLGGNIGRAILTLDPFETESKQVYMVECSSYQIDLAPSVDPSIGVLLNLSPDHLDRHGSMENYAALKTQLVMGSDFSVVGLGDEFTRATAHLLVTVGVSHDTFGVGGGYSANGTQLLHEGDVLADVAGIISLRGAHNVDNALAASAVVSALDVSPEKLQAGLSSFGGLAHRMEQVACYNDVVFINDSKATNADAAEKSLAAFGRIYWIAGGLEKEGGIASLNSFFPNIVHTFLIGEAQMSFAKVLEGRVPFSLCENLEQAVKQASAMALADQVQGQKAVLLAPACASFDQFRNFEVRGDAFKANVMDEISALDEPASNA